MNNISQNIKDLCIEKDISLKQLGKLSKIQDSLIYKYVNKKTTPTVKNLIKLSNFFNCSLDYLVGIEDKSNNKNIQNTKTFFETYKELLDSKNVSHFELCKIIGISNSSYLSWKNGSLPYLDTLLKLSNHFDVSLDYLIGNNKV